MTIKNPRIDKIEVALLAMEAQLTQILEWIDRIESRVDSLERSREMDKKAMDSMASAMTPFKQIGPAPALVPMPMQPNVAPGFPTGPLPPIPGANPPKPLPPKPVDKKQALMDELKEAMQKIREKNGEE